MRLEIKIPYSADQALKIEKNLFMIKEITKHHPSRTVNSIYFDNMDLDMAKDNIDGLSKRCKIRIRYYDGENNNCNLEIKKKLNRFGFKTILDLKKKIEKINLSELFSLKNDLYKSFIRDSFVEKFIVKDNLQPQIKVSYLREYYIFDKIRLTHDKKINYVSLNNDKNFTQKTITDSTNVLEIKFDYNDFRQAKFILDKIKIKPKRFSKYIRGLSFFNSSIYL